MDNPGKLPPSAGTVMPLKRIKAIMKASNTGQIDKEALFLMAKSTELFVKYFAREAHAASNRNGANTFLEYGHLSRLVCNSENLEFLQDFVPEKIKVKDLKKMFPPEDDTDDEESTD